MYCGENIILRPFTEEDALIYLNWVNDSRIASQVIRARPVTPFEHSRWYESVITKNDAVFFSIETKDDHTYIGNVWLWDIDPIHRKGELRILLGINQGKGYGTEACQLLTEFAFKRLNLVKVYLYVLESNPRAKRAFEKAGFKEEALLQKEFFVEGRYHNAYRMAIFRDTPGMP